MRVARGSLAVSRAVAAPTISAARDHLAAVASQLGSAVGPPPSQPYEPPTMRDGFGTSSRSSSSSSADGFQDRQSGSPNPPQDTSPANAVTRPHSEEGSHPRRTREAAAATRRRRRRRGPTEPFVPPEPTRELRESAVATSRFGRLFQAGSLATRVGLSVLGSRLGGGGSDGGSGDNAGEDGGGSIVSEANAERIASSLSRMRGAALKLGQMLRYRTISLG